MKMEQMISFVIFSELPERFVDILYIDSKSRSWFLKCSAREASNNKGITDPLFICYMRLNVARLFR